MSIKIDPQKIARGDLDDREKRYLADRDRLPTDLARSDSLADPQIPLSQRANTGDANSRAFTDADLRRLVELMKEEQAGNDAAEAMLKEVEEDQRAGGGEAGSSGSSDDVASQLEELADVPYEDERWGNRLLRAELASRGLAVSGKKDELIDRLRESDATDGADDAEEEDEDEDEDEDDGA